MGDKNKHRKTFRKQKRKPPTKRPLQTEQPLPEAISECSSSSKKLKSNNCTPEITDELLSGDLGNAIVDMNILSQFLKTLACPQCASILHDVNLSNLGGLAQKLTVECTCGYRLSQDLSKRVGM